jgi:hypothetical protein
MLHDIGFDRDVSLRERISKWRAYFDRIDPDVVLCDHSPTALLALRGSRAKRALIGTGFFCPAPGAFEQWRVPTPAGQSRAIELDTELVLGNANTVLRQLGAASLGSLSELFADVDETFLITVKELDHFPDRENAEYRGVLRTIAGERARWPAPRVFRVFAYLKPFPALAALMSALGAGPFSTLVFTDSVLEEVLRSAAADNLRVLAKPADMMQVSAECDVGITNANHGTICDLLLAGKPVLMIPLTSEQYLLARRVEEGGLGLLAAANDIDAPRGALVRLLEDNSFRKAAKEFQGRYAQLDAAAIARGFAQRIEELV